MKSLVLCGFIVIFFFFFFKQKTAYEMRISDWSSDVCSSDLVLVCQHMPPTFTRLLAERLDGRSPLHVSEATHGEPVRAGGVWIAPGGSHLEVRRSAGGGIVTALTVEPPENSCRPSVDPLLRSATATFGAGVLARSEEHTSE